ncbi:MAG: exodeoxyribonuclease VII small subunit [Candidatus Saccharimonadales bacterium]
MPNKSYQQLESELDEVILKLQSEGLDADAAVELYKKGLKLVEELKRLLGNAENAVTKLKADFDRPES